MKPAALSIRIPIVVVLKKSSRIPWQSGLADKKNFVVYKRSEFFNNFLSEKVDGCGIPVGKAAGLCIKFYVYS